jgi:SHS2 domain-containing protein
MTGAYVELDHPADLMLEIRGRNLHELLENGLYALYDHMVELSQVQGADERLFVVSEEDVPSTLRSLLQEALVGFGTDGFLACSAEVLSTGDGRTRARLHGESYEPERHSLLTEIKAVTYHRLAASEDPTGSWRATVLLDV